RWVENRSLKPAFGKGMAVVLLIGGLSISAMLPANAQKSDTLPVISLEEAVNRAVAHYPAIKIANLKIVQQEALKKTAWDLGNTQIFTGGEEIGEDNKG